MEVPFILPIPGPFYRDETMCTMSEFRVYGSNMMNAMLVLIQSITHL